MTIRPGEKALSQMSHPVVRRHPGSGQAALYVNSGYTVRIDGMTDAESAGLLRFLFDHSLRPEFQIRIAWCPRMLTIWDNRVLQHMAVNDYAGFRREMHRSSVQGEATLQGGSRVMRARKRVQG